MLDCPAELALAWGDLVCLLMSPALLLAEGWPTFATAVWVTASQARASTASVTFRRPGWKHSPTAIGRPRRERALRAGRLLTHGTR
jgi:hypothetical protein